MTIQYITKNKEQFGLTYYEIVETNGVKLDFPFYIAFNVNNQHQYRFSGITKIELFKKIKIFLKDSDIELKEVQKIDGIELTIELEALIYGLLN